MRGWWSYFWWGSAGAILGGAWSAVLAVYASLAPARHLSGLTGLEPSTHLLVLILMGVLMGAASGVCLGRYLYARPARKRNLMGSAVVVVLAMGVLSESGLLDVLRLPDEAVRAEIAAGELRREWLKRVSQPRADLTGAWLPGTDLRGARLSKRCLVGACLTDADLRGADLRGADLREQDLDGLGIVSPTNLERADLRGADLRGANLCGANLIGAMLTGARLTGARYGAHTSWPEGFDPARRGASRTE